MSISPTGTGSSPGQNVLVWPDTQEYKLSQDIERGVLTDALTEFLAEKGWGDKDLSLLQERAGPELATTLIEQATIYDSDVLRIIPKTILYDVEEGISARVETLKALTLLFSENDPGECPLEAEELGGFFIDADERRRCRETYFSKITGGFVPETLEAWLLENNWEKDSIQKIKATETDEKWIELFIAGALDVNDYKALQCLPNEWHEMVIQEIHLTIIELEDIDKKLRFIKDESL